MTPVAIPSKILAPCRSATASPDAPRAVLASAVVASSRLIYVFLGIYLSVSRWFYDAAKGFVLSTSAGRAS